MLLEDVGNRHLLDLTSRSFFQKEQRGDFFHIHDLMHDLEQFVSKDECFRIKNDHQEIPSSIRHLSVCTENLKLHELMNSDNFIKYARHSNSIRSSALTELNVRLWCQNLTSFEEWLLPERLPSIKIIHVIGCRELVSLPVERFEDFIYLQKLSIVDCPKLTGSKKLELNPSIKVLKLKSCGEVERERSLPGCLQNLTSLIKLEICRCLHLESLPGQLLHHMRALKVLRITFCPELRHIPRIF